MKQGATRAISELKLAWYLKVRAHPFLPRRTPRDLFGWVDDDLWFLLNTQMYRQTSRLQEILPGMPAEHIQVQFTGSAGDTTLREAFAAYTLFKQIVKHNRGSITKSHKILDFGCGWGRIIRFFLRDVEPANLWGIDCYPEMIEICRQTNKWCNFQLIAPLPPTSLADNTFDIIYAYSVFSHLAEEAHKQWLVEFKRLLKPGGFLITTTRSRQFIEECAQIRTNNTVSCGNYGASTAFFNTEQALLDYDCGRFCYSPVGGGGVLDSSFYGETCIPKQYVLDYWTEHFTFVDFIEDSNLHVQNVIVMKN